MCNKKRRLIQGRDSTPCGEAVAWLLTHIPQTHQLFSDARLQRLRDISFIGSQAHACPIGPSVFEHSVQIAYTCSRIVKRLSEDESHNLDADDVAHCGIAGLVHKLGCAPFYDAFDMYAPQSCNIRTIWIAWNLLLEKKFPPRAIAWVLYLLQPDAYICPDARKSFLGNLLRSGDGIDIPMMLGLKAVTQANNVSYMCLFTEQDIIESSTVVRERWTLTNFPVAYYKLLQFWVESALLGNVDALTLRNAVGTVMCKNRVTHMDGDTYVRSLIASNHVDVKKTGVAPLTAVVAATRLHCVNMEVLHMCKYSDLRQ